jgi:sugar-specific transcriptional regulator TrmB
MQNKKEKLAMNKLKRKELSKIEARLSDIKNVINDIKSDLEYELGDEEDSLDNMERFSGTDRYAAMEEAVDNMSNAVSSIEEAIENIGNAIEFIGKAQN